MIDATVISVEPSERGYRVGFFDKDDKWFGHVEVQADSVKEAFVLGIAEFDRIYGKDEVAMEQFRTRLRTYTVRHVKSGAETRFPVERA
jgi:hypothetical protein